MSDWSALTRAALLGTQRESVPEPVSPLPILNKDEQNRSAEHRLLAQAGALDLYEQVGRLPARVTGLPDTAPLARESWPVCSPAAAEMLSRMLDGRFQELLPGFLQLLAARQKRVPLALLPNLLQRGIRIAAIRPYLAQVIGERGRWLAGQNASWTYAAVADEFSWETALARWRVGDSKARQLILRRWRAFAPDQGRQLVEITWKSEPETVRVLLIKELDLGLSMADEPFLERALDDRALRVRQQAAQHLSLIADSRYSQRMQSYTHHLLSWHPGQKHGIGVRFPRQITAEMVRDGVPPDKAGNQSVIRSRQLVQMVSSLPLSQWTAQWSTTPAAILQAAQTSRWPRSLLSAFVTATRRQHDVVWAQAILAHEGLSSRTTRLIPLLPVTDLPQLVSQLIADADPDYPLQKDSALLKLFRYWNHAWPRPLALTWLEQMAQQLRADTETRYPGSILRMAIRQFGQNCPTDLGPAARDILSPIAEENVTWRQAINALLNTLDFRAQLVQVVTDSAHEDGNV